MIETVHNDVGLRAPFRQQRSKAVPATMEELENRLTRVEAGLNELKEQIKSISPKAPQSSLVGSIAEQGERLLREAENNQPIISSTVAKAFAEMGIVAKPIGAEKVQEVFAAHGIRLEDNEFSRG